MAKMHTGTGSRDSADWREFELLVASIEKQLGPRNAVVKSPDHVRDLDTKRPRQVDASITFKLGSVEVLITIECRRRSKRQDVTWIEHLATKRQKIGAARTIAVSFQGFSKAARACAHRYGIELRDLRTITPTEVVDLIASESFVHVYRLIESIECNALLSDGRVETTSGLEPRFRHPEVHGLFPAFAFLSFMEMKDPQIFNSSVALGGESRTMSFSLNAEDRNLIPVPLGEQRKKGILELSMGEQFAPVKSLSLTVKLKYVSEKLSLAQGQHHAYGPPGQPALALSQYESNVGGVPVSIEHYTSIDAKDSSAILKFPSGVELPGNFYNPRITDMSKINTVVLNLKAVTIKVQGHQPIDGVSMRKGRPDTHYKFINYSM